MCEAIGRRRSLYTRNQPVNNAPEESLGCFFIIRRTVTRRRCGVLSNYQGQCCILRLRQLVCVRVFLDENPYALARAAAAAAAAAAATSCLNFEVARAHACTAREGSRVRGSTFGSRALNA